MTTHDEARATLTAIIKWVGTFIEVGALLGKLIEYIEQNEQRSRRLATLEKALQNIICECQPEALQGTEVDIDKRRRAIIETCARMALWGRECQQ